MLVILNNTIEIIRRELHDKYTLFFCYKCCSVALRTVMALKRKYTNNISQSAQSPLQVGAK